MKLIKRETNVFDYVPSQIINADCSSSKNTVKSSSFQAIIRFNVIS